MKSKRKDSVEARLIRSMGQAADIAEGTAAPSRQYDLPMTPQDAPVPEGADTAALDEIVSATGGWWVDTSDDIAIVRHRRSPGCQPAGLAEKAFWSALNELHRQLDNARKELAKARELLADSAKADGDVETQARLLGENP